MKGKNQTTTNTRTLRSTQIATTPNINQMPNIHLTSLKNHQFSLRGQKQDAQTPSSQQYLKKESAKSQNKNKISRLTEQHLKNKNAKCKGQIELKNRQIHVQLSSSNCQIDSFTIQETQIKKQKINRKNKSLRKLQKQNISKSKQSNQFEEKKQYHNQIIYKLFTDFLNHPHYQPLQQSKTNPSIKGKIAGIRKKLGKSYMLADYRNDIFKIFQIFNATANEPKSVMLEVQQLENDIKESLVNIEKTQSCKDIKINNLSKQIDKKQSIFLKQKEKSTIVPFKAKNVQSNNQKQKIEQNGQLRNSKNEAVNKQKRARGKQKKQKLMMTQIINLGVNIRQLPSQYLGVICYRYGEDPDEVKPMNPPIYRLDLEKIKQNDLLQLEEYVKKTCIKLGKKYINLNYKEQDNNFIVEDDD